MIDGDLQYFFEWIFHDGKMQEFVNQNQQQIKSITKKLLMTLASFLKKGQRQLVSYTVFLAMIVSITIVKKTFHWWNSSRVVSRKTIRRINKFLWQKNKSRLKIYQIDEIIKSYLGLTDDSQNLFVYDLRNCKNTLENIPALLPLT